MGIWETLYKKAKAVTPFSLCPPCGLCPGKRKRADLHRLLHRRMQLSPENRHMEVLIDYGRRKTITQGELMPKWWGEERYAETK